MSMEPHALSCLMREHAIDVVVNASACCRMVPAATGSCIAISSDSSCRGSAVGRDIRLIQISIPGNADTDRTALPPPSAGRAADRASGIPHAVLRPAWWWRRLTAAAPCRALAVPVDLPAAERTDHYSPSR
jgi:hypothetical protein